MQTYAFSIAAGATLDIRTAGNYARLMQLSAVPSIATPYLDLATDVGTQVTMYGTSNMRLDRQANTWRLSNKTASQIDGKIIIGSGEYGDNNIIATLALIDQASSAVKQGQVFEAEQAITHVLNNNINFAIVNPVGAANDLVVDSWEYVAAENGAGGVFQLGYATEAQITAAVPATKFGRSHLVSTATPANSVGYLAGKNGAAFTTTTQQTWASIGSQAWTYNLGFGCGVQLVRNKPFVIAPGFAVVILGALATGGGALAQVRATWRELKL